ncbi:MAG: hypothetical protein V3W04_03235 [Gammaproteobacteria bacterium]
MDKLIQRLSAYALGIWQNRRFCLSIIVVLAIASCLTISLLPNIYLTQATVYSNNPAIKHTILNSITLATALQKVAPENSPPISEQQVKKLRKNLRLTTSINPENAIVKISYLSKSTERGFRIINSLIENLIAESLADSKMTPVSPAGIRIIEYPQKPGLPHLPNRAFLLKLSYIVSSMAGILLTLYRYRNSPFISDHRQLRKRIHRPILGVIAQQHDQAYIINRRKQTALFLLSLFILCNYMSFSILYHNSVSHFLLSLVFAT